jgi:hypothetical protein
MPRSAVLIMLGLATCSLLDTGQDTAPAAAEMSGWRLASGKAPSRAEYAAMVAACQEAPGQQAAAKPLDVCLADLGLKRVP